MKEEEKEKINWGGIIYQVIVGVVIFGVLALGVVGVINDRRICSKNPFDEAVKRFYETPHQLRKIFVKDEEITKKEPGEGHFSGGFFLLLGGASGSYKEGAETKYAVTNIRFAWEIKDSTYIITTLPIEKIRIKLVEEIETPNVSFFLNKFEIDKVFNETHNSEGRVNLNRILKNYYDPLEAFSKYLAYAVFTVKSKDWPKNINLPVNQNYNK